MGWHGSTKAVAALASTAVVGVAVVGVAVVGAVAWGRVGGPYHLVATDGKVAAAPVARAVPAVPATAAPVPSELALTTTGAIAPAPVAAPGPEPAAAPVGAALAPAPPSGVGGPVTTVSGSAPVDPAGIYRGILGTLGPDDPVTAPVADPPVAAAGLQPLTGWPGPVPARPAAVVKIDNSRPARPQTGIEAADVVYEEEVEGGATRLAAVFHSQGGVVGPVRSGRTTDLPLVVSLGTPLLMYSGANEVTDTLLRRPAAIQDRAASRSSGYWRDRGRRAPSNLYTDVQAHWASAAGGPPPAQFTYRPPGAVFSGTPAHGLALNYRSNPVSWAWNGELWIRSQGGRPHTVAAGGQLAVANVVVVQTQRVDTGMVDSSGATVPELVFVGSGPVSVYSDGQRLDGTWTRPTLASAATLTTPDGAVIALTAGRTWVQIVDAAAGTFQP